MKGEARLPKFPAEETRLIILCTQSLNSGQSKPRLGWPATPKFFGLIIFNKAIIRLSKR
jgi:hypothetical protein